MRVEARVGLALAVLGISFLRPDVAEARCESQFNNRSFECEFVSDSQFISSGSSCITFRDNDLLDPPKFDAIDVGDASIEGAVFYGCSCNTTGTFARPRFNRSLRQFTCAGTEFSGEFDFSWAMTGRLSPSGRILTLNQVDPLAEAIRLRCNRVSDCGNPFALSQDLDRSSERPLGRAEQYRELRLERAQP